MYILQFLLCTFACSGALNFVRLAGEYTLHHSEQGLRIWNEVGDASGAEPDVWSPGILVHVRHQILN